LNSQENVTCELHLKSQNGADFWVSVVASLKKMDDGSTQVRLVFTDTTEKNLYQYELDSMAKYDALAKLT
jgi:hypothetical protein